MLNLIKQSDMLSRAMLTYEFFDDFDGENVVEDWALTNGDSGSAVNGDAKNGSHGAGVLGGYGSDHAGPINAKC